ncbi:MAG: hypothetical protein HDR85_00805 [Bacteroides sp.]|nr:hypothetical protein [Bacteroides sp.]
MRVVVHNYVFPFKEDLGAWRIIWEEIGGSEGYVHLKATIMPNYTKILGKFIDEKILSMDKIENLKCAITLPELAPNIANQVSIPIDEYTLKVYSAIMQFCKQKTFIRSKRSFAWTAFLDFGNTTRTDKCMKIIKKDLVLCGEETIMEELYKYFKSQNICLSHDEVSTRRYNKFMEDLLLQ